MTLNFLILRIQYNKIKGQRLRIDCYLSYITESAEIKGIMVCNTDAYNVLSVQKTSVWDTFGTGSVRVASLTAAAVLKKTID